MNELELYPERWEKNSKECNLQECPSGYFLYDNQICYKLKEKSREGTIKLYTSVGKFSINDHKKTSVQPITYKW